MTHRFTLLSLFVTILCTGLNADLRLKNLNALILLALFAIFFNFDITSTSLQYQQKYFHK